MFPKTPSRKILRSLLDQSDMNALYLLPVFFRLAFALVESDPTVREFFVNTADSEGCFCQFLSLGAGARICFTSPTRRFFYQLFCELGNLELCESLNLNASETEITKENVIDRLLMSQIREWNCSAEIEFCAFHFYELNSSLFDPLPLDIISAIVSHESLRVADEDSFYEMIADRYHRDSNFSVLFEKIHFEHLTRQSISSFLKLIDNSFDILTPPLWVALSARLSLSVSPNISNQRGIGKRMRLIECPLQSGKRLNGVIRYLTKKSGGNVHDRGVLLVTASSDYPQGGFEARNAVDFENQTLFLSDARENSWICYDFQERRFKPAHYTIRARQDANYSHLRSWVVEGSVDGDSWTVVDEHQSDATLNHLGAIATFRTREIGEFRYIRLRQTAPNADTTLWLALSAFELFGLLLEPLP